MNKQFQPNSFFAKIMPFFGVGIFIVLFIAALVFLSYILLIGAVIGIVLFVISYIRNKFFGGKTIQKTPPHIQHGEVKKDGNVYEHKK